jgi:NADH:ubiquinone oxidoreductase subunit H
MWEIVKGASVGVLTGKLFSNPGATYGIFALGMAITAALFLGGWKLGLSVPVAAVLAAFVGGILQPRLSRNLKIQ